MSERKLGAKLARYELRAAKNGLWARKFTAQRCQRAKNKAISAEIHRTELLPRQNGPEFLLASLN